MYKSNHYNFTENNILLVGTSGHVMVSKLDQQTFKDEFESQ